MEAMLFLEKVTTQVSKTPRTLPREEKAGKVAA
jgi:hypothetical protein